MESEFRRVFENIFFAIVRCLPKLTFGIMAIYIAKNSPTYLGEEYELVSVCITLLLLFVYTIYGAYAPISTSIRELVSPDWRSSREKETAKLSKIFAVLFTIGTFVAIGLLILDYVGHQEGMKDLGTFGDFFGGVLNPILSFVTVVALAITFILQHAQIHDGRTQAAETRRIAQQQMFESTLFNMVALHNSTVEQLHFTPASLDFNKSTVGQQKAHNGTEIKGRAVFAAVLEKMREQSDSQILISGDREGEPRKAYEIIQSRYNFILGHYFRNLFQVLHFIDKFCPLENDLSWSLEIRKQYTKILRAQLSANELVLLYFNCYDELVDDGTFRRLLIKYTFLEHIPVELDRQRRALFTQVHNFEIDAEEYFLFNDEQIFVSSGAFGKNRMVDDYIGMTPESAVG